MNNRYSQTGSIKARFRKLAVFSWHNIRKFGKLSLAGIRKAVKKVFQLDWLKIFKCIKLIIEITRSLLFCNQPQMLFGNWANNKSYTDS